MKPLDDADVNTLLTVGVFVPSVIGAVLLHFVRVRNDRAHELGQMLSDASSVGAIVLLLACVGGWMWDVGQVLIKIVADAAQPDSAVAAVTASAAMIQAAEPPQTVKPGAAFSRRLIEANTYLVCLAFSYCALIIGVSLRQSVSRAPPGQAAPPAEPVQPVQPPAGGRKA